MISHPLNSCFSNILNVLHERIRVFYTALAKIEQIILSQDLNHVNLSLAHWNDPLVQSYFIERFTVCIRIEIADFLISDLAFIVAEYLKDWQFLQKHLMPQFVDVKLSRFAKTSIGNIFKNCVDKFRNFR